MFRRNGDGTFIVAVKIGGDSKKMMGLGAISFDKAFNKSTFYGIYLSIFAPLYYYEYYFRI
jgi:hypothetical protein